MSTSETTVPAWTLSRYVGRAEAEPHTEDVRGTYAEVYAEEPYNEGPQDVAEWLAGTWPRHMDADGFALVIARVPNVGTVGMAYGIALPAGSRWWSGMHEPLPAEEMAEDGRRTFAVIEFAIRAPYRRRGLGRAMHAALIGPWRGERTTLTARPEADAAMAFWQAEGYKPLGPSRPWDAAPLYVMMRRQAD